MSMIITRTTRLDNMKSLETLANIDKSLKTIGKSDILSFLENNNLVEKCLPVDTDKNVVTGGAASASSKMEISGIKTILNNPGTPQRFKGLNDNEKKTGTVKAVGFAVQHRYSTIGIDLDCNVFDGVDSEGNLVSGLPEALIEWLAVHHPYALKVRGNRKRLTLVFGVSEELGSHIRSYGHKKVYTLSVGVQQRVEVGMGNVNNTVYGYHPTAKAYQQILPDGGLLGELSLESFAELIDILDKNSLVIDKKYGGTKTGRIRLDTAHDQISPIANDVANYVNLIDKLDLDVDLTCTIAKFLNPETIEIIEGRKFFDGSNYIECDPEDEFTIASGSRFFTYFNVGSDVNAIAYILESADIYFESSEVDDIIDTLWERTDSTGSGKKDEYHQREAIAAFNATAASPTLKSDYLPVVVLKIRKELNSRLMKAIEDKKSEHKVESISEVAKIMETKITEEQPVEDENNSDDFGVFDECVEETIQSFKEVSENIADSAEKVKETKYAPLPEGLGEATKKFIDKLGNAKNRATSDDWAIFNPLLREVLEFSNDANVDGFSFAIMTQTIALLSGVGGYVTVRNKEYAPFKKNTEALNPYRTAFIPFAVVVGESGAGKSQVKESFHTDAIKLVDLHQHLSPDDEFQFKIKFGTPKNNDKLRSIEIDEATGKPKDPMLVAVASVLGGDAKLTLGQVAKRSANCVTDDVTDAGYRDNLVAQEAQVALREATNGLHFGNAYSHPVVIYSDEINSVFKKMFDATITYGGSPEFFMMRKNAGSMKIARGGQSFEFNTAGLAVAGNLVTNKAQEYIGRELKDGTDGITPRFNFAMVEKVDNKDHSKTEWGASRKEDAKVDMAGIMFAARFASIHADKLINCPYSDHTLNFNDGAQEEYGKFIEFTAGLEASLIGKFGDAKSYLKSMFGKASSELAIYAGGVSMLNQCTNLWIEAKKYLPDYEEMKRLLLSGKVPNLLKLGKLINDALAMVITDFQWSLCITADDIKNAAKIVNHHYDFIEYSLEEIIRKDDADPRKRALKASQEKVIAAVEGESYRNETHIKSVCVAISNVVQDGDDEFTISNLNNKTSTIRKLNNEGGATRIYEILDYLIEIGEVERLETVSRKGMPKFRLKNNIVHFNRQIPLILSSIRGL